MKNKWFHFMIDRENVFALFCGLLMILLSAAMTLFHSELMNVVLRDICMVLLLGFFLPIYYIVIVKRKSLSVLGFHKNKLTVSLIINIIAGIFEMIFIYGFLRYEFERAFGILPAVFITAVFYSLHHAGFQPEFTKLFFVGMMYITVFYFTRNLFSIFPFFWGVGAVWDVLVNSEAGSQIKNERSFIIAILLFLTMTGMSIFIYRKYKSNSHFEFVYPLKTGL